MIGYEMGTDLNLSPFQDATLSPCDLTGQCRINRGRIEAAEPFVSNDDNGQRAQAHAHQFLHGVGIGRHVLFGVWNSLLR